LYFSNQEQLDSIIDSLSPELYNSMLEYAKINFDLCFNFPINNDSLYDMHYKNIIQKINLINKK